MDRLVRFRRAMLTWHRRHSRSFPWRETRNPYEVLIGAVMLQRTQGSQIASVYATFLARWPTPEKLARARESSIATVIRPLGLAKRAPILSRLGKALSVAGGVPTDPADLDRLPGVGPYAARAVPVFAGERNLPLVDGVIARVLRRYFGLPGESRPSADKDAWALAERLTKGGRARELWLGTLDFAAAMCRPRPLCPECPLRTSCSFIEAGGSQDRPSRTRIT